MLILGISAFHRDSAAALVDDGEIVAAAQEERFSRRRRDARFPAGAIRACLGVAGARPADIDLVVFHAKPFLKLDRAFETCLAFAPRGFRAFREGMPVWMQERLFQKRRLVEALAVLDERVDWEPRLLFSEHHLSQAASAFYPSPYARAAVLCVDGVGEWATTSLAVGEGNELRMLREIHFPHSLGLLYGAFAHYLGFGAQGGERCLELLAPYGEARHARLISDRLVDVKEDGSFRLSLSYFDCCPALALGNRRFHELFGAPPRAPGAALMQRHMDIAASIQSVCEDIVCRLARNVARDTGEKNLCLAGSMTGNAACNRRLLQLGSFERLWMQPAAGEAGAAPGAALAAYHLFLRQARPIDGVLDGMRGGLLGPAWSQADIELRLRRAGARFEVLDDAGLISAAARALAAGEVLAWFQGRMEFGENALGARSVYADARSPLMQKLLSSKLGQPGSFRPFAAVVLAEDAAEWFDLPAASPYQLYAAGVAPAHRIGRAEGIEDDAGIAGMEGRDAVESAASRGLDRLQTTRSSIPAVTHVDYSSRVQTLRRDTHPRTYALLSRFRRLTGCSVLATADLKLPGEPLACTPEEAYQAFLRLDLDCLAMGNCFMRKVDQRRERSHPGMAQVMVPKVGVLEAGVAPEMDGFDVITITSKN